MYPICHIFVSEKSVDKSGFVDKSGCDKSEDALYIVSKNHNKNIIVQDFLTLSGVDPAGMLVVS